MKKILLLGGSEQQVIAIRTAQRLGFYTVLCDFLDDNPGQYVADKFYLISTTDKEAVLNVARKENVAGVLAYASDPAAPTAAYVAEKMNLPSNPFLSVDILCNKDKFREFLRQNGYNAPSAKGFNSFDEAKTYALDRELPFIVKPVDSSGSKGITVVKNKDVLDEAIKFAFEFSRSKRVVIEKYIEKKHQYLIGGDIFVLNGKVVLWGLLNCHRDAIANELVPSGKSFPLLINSSDNERIKDTLQKMVDDLKINFGAMNVELVIDNEDKIWPIDIGPRNGGNMIPDLLGMIYGVDLVEMSVKVAMNMPIEYVDSKPKQYYATYNLHAIKEGNLKEIIFSDNLEKKIIRKCIYKKCGEKVEFFDNASKAIGIIFMKFSSEKEMLDYLSNIEKHVNIVLEI